MTKVQLSYCRRWCSLPVTQLVTQGALEEEAVVSEDLVGSKLTNRLGCSDANQLIVADWKGFTRAELSWLSQSVSQSARQSEVRITGALCCADDGAMGTECAQWAQLHEETQQSKSPQQQPGATWAIAARNWNFISSFCVLFCPKRQLSSSASQTTVSLTHSLSVWRPGHDKLCVLFASLLRSVCRRNRPLFHLFFNFFQLIIIQI